MKGKRKRKEINEIKADQKRERERGEREDSCDR